MGLYERPFGRFYVKKRGRLAQLARALRSHRRGRWFESNIAHINSFKKIDIGILFIIFMRE